MIDGWGIYFKIALIWMPLDFTDDQAISDWSSLKSSGIHIKAPKSQQILSGKSLVPTGNESLTGPGVTQIYVTIWRH